MINNTKLLVTDSLLIFFSGLSFIWFGLSPINLLLTLHFSLRLEIGYCKKSKDSIVELHIQGGIKSIGHLINNVH